MTAATVTNLATFRQRRDGERSEQELIDDIGARTFIYLRDQADANGLPISTVIAEHMLGMALVVEAVEGTGAARSLVNAIKERLGVR